MSNTSGELPITLKPNHILSVSALLLCVCANCAYLCAQAPAYLDGKDEISTYSGIKGGLVIVDMGPITNGPYGLAGPPVDFPITIGSEFGIEAGARLPFSESLGFNAGIGFGIEKAQLYTTVPGFVSPRVIPIPVTFGETLDLDWWTLTMQVRLQWTLGHFDIQPGIGAIFPGSISAVATEHIIEPPGATYDEVSTTRTRFNGGIVSTTALLASLRLSYVIPITSSLDLIPFAEGNYAPFSLASELDMRTSSAVVGLQVRLASSFFVAPDVTPIMITAPTPPPDQVVWGQRRFEPPLPEISMLRKPYLASAVHVELTGPDAHKATNSNIVVHVLNCLRLRLVETDLDPDATIWDATRFELIHKDSILDASPPTAVIRVRSTAEAGVHQGLLRAISDGAIAYERTWLTNTDTVFVWPLRELPVTAIAGDTTTISIQSTVTDYFGGESTSIPQTIIVIRSRPTKRSALVPDLVTAEFTEPTFTSTGADLSKAGRGLVAALSDHAQEAKVIRLTGPLDRCKRVLSELSPTGNVRVQLPQSDTATTKTVMVMIER